MDRINLMTIARSVIEEIMFTYAEGIDLGDIETVAELFTEGAIVLPDGNEIRGYQEVFDTYAGMVMFRSGFKYTFGYCCLNVSAKAQWVVAVFPSSKPVSAKRKAPVQTPQRWAPW